MFSHHYMPTVGGDLPLRAREIWTGLLVRWVALLVQGSYISYRCMCCQKIHFDWLTGVHKKYISGTVLTLNSTNINGTTWSAVIPSSITFVYQHNQHVFLLHRFAVQKAYWQVKLCIFCLRKFIYIF